MILRIGILSLVIYIFFLIPEKFLNLDYFKITKINTIDNSKMLQSELTNLTKKIYNKKSTQINYRELENFYRKDLRIKDIKIQNDSLGKIIITTEGKKLKYYTVDNNRVFLMNENGEIFGYLNESKRQSLPFVIGKNREERLEIIEILDRISQLQIIKYVSQITKIKEDDYRITLLDGVKLKTRPEVELKKYKIVESLYSEIRNHEKLDYIDLRFEDYIIKYIGDEK